MVRSKKLVTYMKLLIAISAATFYIHIVLIAQHNNQVQQNGQSSLRILRVKRGQFIFPESAKEAIYGEVPIYARKRVETKEERDLATKVISYRPFGKATVIVKFKSSFPNYHVTQLSNQNARLFKHSKVIKTFFNGNITIHNTNNESYFMSSENFIYILSAILSFRKPYSQILTNHKYELTTGNEVIFAGWVQEMATNATLLCCLLHKNQTVIYYNNMKRIIWTQVKKQDLLATKVYCPIPLDIEVSALIGASLSLESEQCLTGMYMGIEKPEGMTRNSVGICSKIIYGDIEAARVVEWVEIQKYIQIDKIVMYVYNLNKKTAEILRHYAEDGFLELVPFDYPLADDLDRYVGQKAAMAFIDEQVVVFDCMERLQGYTYTAIMDVDEILYAKNEDNNVKILMEQLMEQYPTAGGFTFMTELFITDWPTEGQSDSGLFWHTRHQNRTEAILDRPKNMLVVDRVVLGSVWTHNYTTKQSFTRHTVPVDMAVVKHYRPCRQNWSCYERNGRIDKSIVDIVLSIADDIYKKFNFLGLDYD